MRQIFRIGRLALAGLLGSTLSGAQATIVAVVAVPTNWQVENYSTDESVVIWFAVSGCAAGGLRLPTYATQEQRNRLYATIASGKLAGQKVGIRYDDGSCLIDSFYFPPS